MDPLPAGFDMSLVYYLSASCVSHCETLVDREVQIDAGSKSCESFPMTLGLRLSALSLVATLSLLEAADPLADGFRNPPMAARPSTYYLLLNGYVNRDFIEQELAA